MSWMAFGCLPRLILFSNEANRLMSGFSSKLSVPTILASNLMSSERCVRACWYAAWYICWIGPEFGQGCGCMANIYLNTNHMALNITHTFVSAKADGADATQVRPSNWNATHTIAGTTDTLQTVVPSGATVTVNLA